MNNKAFSLLLLSLAFLGGCGGPKKKKPEPCCPEVIEYEDPCNPCNRSSVVSYLDEGSESKDNEQFAFDVQDDDEVDQLVFDDESYGQLEEEMLFADADLADDEKKCVVYYDYDSVTPCEGQEAILVELNEKVENWLAQGYQVGVRGHSCAYSPKAGDTYNEELSKKRAEYLVSCLDIDAEEQDLIKVSYVGYKQPIKDINELSKEAQAPNRCVEVYPIELMA